jgi:hypothetical protein
LWGIGVRAAVIAAGEQGKRTNLNGEEDGDSIHAVKFQTSRRMWSTC